MKSANSPTFVASAFQNEVEYRNSDFKNFIGNDLATSCKNPANFVPVTREFKRLKSVHLLVDQQFRYALLAAPLLDTVGISTEFCGAISTQFCFTNSQGGVTAMPRGLHARLCHAFLLVDENVILAAYLLKTRFVRIVFHLTV